MYGVSLLHLARLVGLRQVDLAAYLGINRVQAHYWSSGLRPIPEATTPTVVKRITEAVARYLATGETDMRMPEAVASDSTVPTPRKPTRHDLATVLHAVFAENLERAGYGFASSPAAIDSLLAELRAYEALTPAQQRHPPQLTRMTQVSGALHLWGTLLFTLTPLLELLTPYRSSIEEDSTHARD